MEHEKSFSTIHFEKHLSIKENKRKISYWLEGLPTFSEIDEIINYLEDLKNKETRDYWTQRWKEEDEYWEREIEKNKNITKQERKKQKGYIYVIKSQNNYKIGRAKNIDSRIKKYITENPHEIEVIFKMFVDDYVEEENKLLKMFEKCWIRGEWFNLNEEDIIKIKQQYEKV